MLEYSYSLKGREYTGHNGVFDFVCWPEATDFVAQHQPGTLVKIAYDPTNHQSLSFLMRCATQATPGAT